LQEYLEKKYEEEVGADQAVRLAIATLLEVVESEKSIEVCVVRPDNSADMLKEEQIAEVVKSINDEKDAAEAAKKKVWATQKQII